MIEIYRPELIDEFMRLGMAMHSESSYRKISFNREKVAKIPEKDVFCVLSKQGDVYTGFFVGQICSYYFSDEVDAHDVAFFVMPEYRSSPDAIELITAYENWAEKKGVRYAYLAQSSGVQIERVDKLFNYLGYEKLGSVVRKEF